MDFTKESREWQMTSIQTEAFEMFSKKNKDYGDAFAIHGPLGILIRIGDKLNRLQHITKTGVTMVKSEGVRDTLIDLHNYAAMAIMLIDEKKPLVFDVPEIHEDTTR
jgi:hypothetical protein